MPKINLQKEYQQIKMKAYLEKNGSIVITIIYFLTVIFSVGYYHFDEHFQLIEFAGYKLGFNAADYLPWEFHDKMRAAIQPFIVYVVSKLFLFFNCYNPFHITFILRLLSAILAAYSTIVFTDTFKHQITNIKNRKAFIALSFLLWFAVFHKVRFSSENWSACIFVISLSLFFKPNIKSNSNLIFIGFLLGLSFMIKFQIGFCIFGFICWLFFVQKSKIKEIVFIITGLLLAVAVSFTIDYWFYSQVVFTPWNYLQQVLFAKYRGSFDSEPWWYFFSETFNRAIPPFSIFIIGSFFVLFLLNRKSVFSWVIFPFLFIHFFIGHKEIRFLFPIIPFIPFIIIYSHELLLMQFKQYQQLIQHKASIFLIQSFWFINFCLLLVIAFKPADSQILLYKAIYNQYDKPTILYYMDNNPYLRVLDIHFYKRNNLVIKKIDNADEIKLQTDTASLFVFEKEAPIFRPSIIAHTIYTTYPYWVNYFNFNNWISRTHNYRVISLKRAI